MEVNRIPLFPLGTFVIFLFLPVLAYFISKLFGYTFVPNNGLALNIICAVLIIFFTINGIKYRNIETKMSTVFSTILPAIATIFIFFGIDSFNYNGTNFFMSLILASITLICSMVLFFLYKCGKIIKIILGITYFILIVFMFLIFYTMVFFKDFSSNTLIKSEMSPNSIYLAEIIYNNQGALGGNTLVNVTHQKRDINLLIGKLKKDPKLIYRGKWGEFETMALRWETDEILYINGNKYDITK